ncbi:MAG: thioredoxin-like domain-containing protein [Rariglobus sp.]
MKLALVSFAVALSLITSTSAKVETWTDLDGRNMEAELISTSDKYASFRKTDGTRYVFPLDKLSEADQARARAASGKVVVTGTDTSATSAPAAAAPAPAPAIAGKLTSELTGKLVALKGKTLAPHARENILGAKYYAIYFSAHWCPPCRGFTPELVDAYKDLKKKNPDFEVVFVSSDEDKDAMQGYMAEYKMTWPAVRFDLSKGLSAVRKFSGNGIPNLVFVTADGEVLSSSYVDGKYVGPRKVLKDIQKTLAAKS